MRTPEKMVQSGDTQLATVAHGEPKEGTILLVMGATASMLWWPEPLIKALVAGGYQVIHFDHRDTGRSTTKSPGDVTYDLNDLAGDLLAVLDAYGVSQAHFVGMSLGGYLSQINALRHPDRVLSLTLIASEPFGISYEAEGIGEDFMAHFSTMASLDWANRQAVTAFLLRIAELSAGTRGPFERSAARDRIEGELSRTSSMRSAFNHSMIAGSIDLQETAADLHCPVLLIHGSEDPIISVNAAHKSAQVIPRAELMILEGVGHELMLRDTPAIAGRILKLCSSAKTRPA